MAGIPLVGGRERGVVIRGRDKPLNGKGEFLAKKELVLSPLSPPGNRQRAGVFD